MKVEINKLKTIKNFADSMNVSTTYIYRLIKEKRMNKIEIDGIQFIDTVIFKTLPTK